MRVRSTSSWGSSLGSYSSGPYYVDAFMYDNPGSLILFAAANDGGDYGDESIAAPGVAKNCLTVGAAESEALPTTTVASFSSRGPTTDGRISPDLIGPGNALDSASASGSFASATCDVTSKSGTSMAVRVRARARWRACVGAPWVASKRTRRVGVARAPAWFAISSSYHSDVSHAARLSLLRDAAAISTSRRAQTPAVRPRARAVYL